ncbi:uncharacterized protein TM35_000092220 [Trypanosoma theileri]|uniref:Uncharacterized protein n=1 Tax=Trypanosoma theileri TaxID=67003 RepID=A0A1X0NZR8_9TRYP|nr:uncharacterized protein TM35_000092220 [Trypanosoma theileri]ORC90172.1 hypothetical protein TM35_000092220 [Trypanosoma theileri]
MFFCARCCLRSATPRGLRSHLRRLRAVSQAAQRELRERRQQQQKEENTNKTFSSSSSSSSPSSSSSCGGVRVEWLPRNDALESAIALAISENRDARTELEFTRHFLQGSFLSLASPVGPWDPYDTKPQVFALGKYIALPVFTSLAYLRLFCKQFRFTVRDPSGILWADGPADAAEEERTGAQRCNAPPLPDVSKSEWWERYVKQQQLSATPLIVAKEPAYEQEVHMKENSFNSVNNQSSILNADDLFQEVELTPQENVDTSNKEEGICKKKKLKKLVRRTKRIKKGLAKKFKYKMKNKNSKIIGGNNRGSGKIKISKRNSKKRDSQEANKEEVSPEENAANNHSDLHEAFWAKVSATAPFRIAQATPLPVFGPLLRPFFVGYFADIDTLLHNASIVPDKVDIVLNPCSAIEFVLAREATNRILQKDQLLLLAYQRVEKELRGEFHRFLHYFAPEVAWARSSCVPSPVPGKPDEVKYELVILLQSDDFGKTFSSLRAAKARCLLMGHADLDVLPWEGAAPYVREASTLFYERTSLDDGICRGEERALGVFEQRGPVETINVAQSADSFYHDPTAAYTEGHAVFTEELRLKRRLR